MSMAWRTWLILLPFLGMTTSETKQNGVYIPGDIILGGLFPVHTTSQDKERSCGHKTYNRGIQRLEAMLYAIDTINADDTLLKDISLGVNILDTCGRDTYALNQSLEFIRSSLQTSDVSQYECSNGGGTPQLKFNSTGSIKGVIGGSYSTVSIQVANLLRLFRIPQISPASTAKALSDKSRFEMFARTVPPDTFQADALVDIVKKFSWTYVSTIASEGSYGESGIDVFQREAEKRNICIAISEKVPSNADKGKFIEVVKNLLKKPNAKAVVLFTRAEDARGILEAAQSVLKEQGTAGQKFFFLASDGWGKQSQVVKGIEDFAVGAITVELESKKISGFDDYLKKLTPEKNERNFWFRDYWEDLFDCDVDQSSYELRNSRQQNRLLPYRPRRKLCDPQKRLSDLPSFEQDSKVQFVIDAVYAFAHALDALKKDVCPKVKGICDGMTYYDGGNFYKKYLLNVDFKDMADSRVKFDKKGDGLPRYKIYNYQKGSNGETDYKNIGTWYSNLTLKVEDIMWSAEPLTTTSSTSTMSTTSSTSTTSIPMESTLVSSLSTTTAAPTTTAVLSSIPRSVCSLPCLKGEIYKMNTGDTCCWICQKCKDYEFVFDKHNCKDCGEGYWPYENKTGCSKLPAKYIHWNTVFAIVPICIACLGIILTLTTIGILVKFADTPLVRASGRELCYVILGGILLCYLNTFILLAKPGIVVCTLQRFTVGMAFSMVYGAMLTKTNRISRIFHSASQSARRPSYISPKSQLIITAVLVSVQVAATLVWVVAALPGSKPDYPKRNEVILKCNVNDSSFMISQVYNMVLITVCTYYAILTRKVPENFNEAKFIGFTMYTTCIIWLAFVPIYFGTGNSFEIQITTLCISISMSAFTTLICLFSPKVYIIVFQPEKNVRKLTMNSVGQKKTTTSLVMPAPGTGGNSGNNGLVVSSAPPIPTNPSPRPSLTPSRLTSASDPVKPSLTSLTVTSNLKVVNDLKSPSEAVILETKPAEEQSRPKRISFCKPETNALTTTVNVATETTLKSPVENKVVKEVVSESVTSPSSPCSQCLREESKKANTAEISPSGHNGGQEFFGSSEECCSSWSGCCNSSCDYNDQIVTQQHPTQPLQVNMSEKVFYGPLTQTLPVKSVSKTEVSRAAKVATISCPNFESRGRLAKMSRSVPEDLPGELDDGANQRHLVTFVTPSMETIPLEMCQDIPDVLI